MAVSHGLAPISIFIVTELAVQPEMAVTVIV